MKYKDFFDNGIIYSSAEQNQKFAYQRHFKENTNYIIDLTKTNLLCVDNDVKSDNVRLRDFVTENILDTIISKTQHHCFVEYSQNNGIHIYVPVIKTINEKVIFKTFDNHNIEILNNKVCTNQKSEYVHNEHENIEQYLNYVLSIPEKELITDVELLQSFENIDCIKNAKPEAINSLREHIKKINHDIKNDVFFRAIDRIFFKQKTNALLKVFNHINIEYKTYVNRIDFNCLLHSEKRSSCSYYYNSNHIIDYHTEQSYTILSYLIDAYINNINELRQMLSCIFHIVDIQTIEKQTTKNIFCTIDETINISSKYIDIETITKIINTNQNCNIVAQTGTGKTTAILNYLFYNTKENAILFLPYILQVQQIERNIFNILDAQTFNEQSKVNDTFSFLYEKKKYRPTRIIVTTYDSFFKINEKYTTFVIDEYHNFLSQRRFRYNALRNIEKQLENDETKKIVKITATPNAIFYTNQSTQNEKTYLVNTLNTSTINFNKVFFRSVHEKIEYIINNHKQNTIDVILLNNIRKIKKYEKQLTKLGFNVLSIYSLKRNDESIKSIYIEQRFIDCDFVFTTTIIADGINILNENINNIYIFNTRVHITTIEQFIARFRSIETKNVYMLTLYETSQKQIKSNNHKYFDVSNMFNKIYEQAKNVVEKMNNNDTNTIQEYQNNKILNFVKLNDLNVFNYVFYDKNKQAYSINVNKIKTYVFEKYDKFIKYTPDAYKYIFHDARFEIQEQIQTLELPIILETKTDYAQYLIAHKNEIINILENISSRSVNIRDVTDDLNTIKIYSRLQYLANVFGITNITSRFDMFSKYVLCDNKHFNSFVNSLIVDIILKQTDIHNIDMYDTKTKLKLKMLFCLRDDTETEQYTREQLIKKYKKVFDVKFIDSILHKKHKKFNNKVINIAVLQRFDLACFIDINQIDI